jgi:sarcosine oxidase subunit beta
MAELPAVCDFLVIGAGIAGVSAAAALAARGATVGVAEATQVCGGSSALNAGGLRQQFSQPLNITLAQRTVGRVGALIDRGIDLGYRQTGYLFMVSDERVVSGLQAAISTQNSLGVPTRWLSVEEIVALVPDVHPDGLLGAAFCPTDGYLDPNTLVTTIAADARAAGAVIASNTPVTGFDTAGERITSVRLRTGATVSAGAVVNCAGAWADGIARLYGASLPIIPWRSQVYVVEGAVGVTPDSPMTIDFNNGKTYFHPESATTVFAGTDADDACETSWRVPYDKSKADIVGERLARRFRSFENAGIRRGWAGMLEVTADENPVADWTHFDNCYTIAGFSGHGLPLAPSLAEEAAAELTGATPSLDLSPYRIDRLTGPVPSDSVEAMSMR